MIRQQFSVRHYWEVTVYYSLDYDLFPIVGQELLDAGLSWKGLRTVYGRMKNGKALAVTFSNIEKHISIVLFNTHHSWLDYLNSLVHEAEHVKQAMLEAYQVEDRGEPPAYTVGYIVERMWEGFRQVR